MRKEKRGPGVVKQPGPQRMTGQIKRLIKDKAKEIESPEAKLFLQFAEIYPPCDLTLHVAEGIWSFIQFLKERGFLIIQGEDILCCPASKLVRLKDLK